MTNDGEVGRTGMGMGTGMETGKEGPAWLASAWPRLDAPTSSEDSCWLSFCRVEEDAQGLGQAPLRAQTENRQAAHTHDLRRRHAGQAGRQGGGEGVVLVVCRGNVVVGRVDGVCGVKGGRGVLAGGAMGTFFFFCQFRQAITRASYWTACQGARALAAQPC